MPGFNGKGPMGEGSKTGGGRGYCNASNAGYGRRFVGTAGFGRRMAYGRGFRSGYGSGPGISRRFDSFTENAADELILLQQQLDLINKRITDLKNN